MARPVRAPDEAGSAGTQVSRRVVIANQRGLHARAAARLVQMALAYEAVVHVACHGVTVRATSVTGLLSLGARLGRELVISAEGPAAAAAVPALAELVRSKFDED